MEEQTSSPVESLSEAIMELSNAMEKMTGALAECRKAGMTPNDMRDEILQHIPEENRAAFIQQWPMLSMVLMTL